MVEVDTAFGEEKLEGDCMTAHLLTRAKAFVFWSVGLMKESRR
jgi:hypothetical protein